MKAAPFSKDHMRCNERKDPIKSAASWYLHYGVSYCSSKRFHNYLSVQWSKFSSFVLLWFCYQCILYQNKMSHKSAATFMHLITCREFCNIDMSCGDPCNTVSFWRAWEFVKPSLWSTISQQCCIMKSCEILPQTHHDCVVITQACCKILQK